MIEIRDLIKNFGRRNILNISRLSLEEGVITAITGENGLGKSTLFNIIAGLDEDYEGTVSVGAGSRDTTLVQHPPVMLNRSVWENIAYPLRLRRLSPEEIHSRVEELLDLFGIRYIAAKNALSLSSGERQKTALARALSFYPRLLLLDEPASNLDPESSELIEGVIREFSTKHNTTILLISHDREQVKRVSDRNLNLKDYLNKEEI